MNFLQVKTTELMEYNNVSKNLQSLPTTHYELRRTTALSDDFSATSEIYNNTRLRRRAPPFGHGELSRRPRHRVHHEHFQEVDIE